MPNFTLSFHFLAREEVSDAYQYYETQRAGLGDTFLATLDDALNLILENPSLHPIDFENIRKALLKIFPFSIYYETIEDKIYIYSVFHQSRNPTIWQDRTIQ